MLFDNLFLGLEGLPEPVFSSRVLRDINPLGKSEKSRLIEMPNETMRIIHNRLIRYLRGLPSDYLYATGCLPRNSPLKNARRHKSNCFFYLLDLKSAYLNVDIGRLAEILCRADPSLNGCSEKVKVFLKRYCLSRLGGLAIGAPASPDLFNIYCLFLLDNPLGELIKPLGLTYSRYLDDLTFSSRQPISRRTRKEIRAVIYQTGFSISHLKSKVADLQKGPIFINGVGLELGGRVFVSQDFVRHLQGLIYQGLRGNFTIWPKIEGTMGVFRSIVRGKYLTQRERKVVKAYRQFRRLMEK